MQTWLIVIIVIAAFIFGIIATCLMFTKSRTYGVLRIDKTNPSKTLYRFEVNSLENIEKKKKVVLKIISITDISRQ